jgi:SAM-dependent methyltransferase
MAQKCGFFLSAYREITTREFSKLEPIVDFGCGSGAAVEWLTSEGYCANGVDILEYWGGDSRWLGEVGPVLSDRVRAKLHVIDPIKNRLPFGDSSIGLLFSDQTLEHVFDYRPVFVEQARVLKPGGVAIHRFPHRFCLIEPHTKLPVGWLTRFGGYLVIWAILGRRNERQLGFSWRHTFASNRKLLATTNYVSRRTIFRAASGLGLDVWFDDFLNLSGGRAGRLYRAAVAKGIGAMVQPVLFRLQDNRILVLRKLPTSQG